MKDDRHPSSFRDPSGFIFNSDGQIYRQINKCYASDYDQLMQSGLYEALIAESLLIEHEEVNLGSVTGDAYKIIKPINIPFVSYPYEWCFSQLKDAALVTLKIQKTALKHGMSLKDCSSYNIQFVNGRAVFIDTLSFERYKENEPWIAYRQFCQHFLSTLALMSYKDIRLNQLLRVFIDGIPLELASSILPLRTRLSFPLLCHIHLQSKSQKHYEAKVINKKKLKLSLHGMLSIIDSLESAVKRLKWKKEDTEWGNYYESTNYTENAMENKKNIVEEFFGSVRPESVWDFGANTGFFSRIASDAGINTIAFDIDPLAVEKNYLFCRKNDEMHLLPLVLDLTNPSSSIGWANQERMSILERGPVDALFAFALIHHLAISNNLPLNMIADFFSKICRYLIIEYVPKSDSQVQKLLSTREDIFPDYTKDCFEKEFSHRFAILKSDRIKDSERTIYLCKNKHV